MYSRLKKRKKQKKRERQKCDLMVVIVIGAVWTFSLFVLYFISDLFFLSFSADRLDAVRDFRFRSITIWTSWEFHLLTSA